jgi:hypothetical protein
MSESFVTSVVKIKVDSPEQGGELLQAFPNFTGAIRVVDGQPLLSAREPLVVSAQASTEEKIEAAVDSAQQWGRPCLVSYEVIDQDGQLLESGPGQEID